MARDSLSQLVNVLSSGRALTASDLNAALSVRNDFAGEVPFVQYPMPAPAGSAHSIAVRFSRPLDAASVKPDSVFLVVAGEPSPVEASVRLADEHTIEIEPAQPLRAGRNDKDIVHIIVTPDVAMADGRPFAGMSFPAVLG
ncbi:Ig-like domain-containing protein [Bradyrhizobium yuanmingense]|uniref:Ig-like domain-containing protein n=1 Tax=Bradyrhizobium yuanmingense TaxID=108015 RepID=UPI0023BA38F6|nr:Ig-like domain-containing protein [Bradyrhizobium yuanmingense]MDF0492759.1 Ig-like domain-containing protein [Bradyrhizobium yuanmingense]